MNNKVKIQYRKPLLELCSPNKEIQTVLTDRTQMSAYAITLVEKVNETAELSFSMPFENSKLTDQDCEKLVKLNGEYYVIKEISVNDNDSRVIDVKCYHESVELKGILCETIDVIGVTVAEMFKTIIDSCTTMDVGYKFKGTDIPDTTKRSLQNDNEVSVYENLVKMAEVFQAVLEFSVDAYGNKQVYLRKESIDRGKFVKKSNGLKQLNITYDSNELFTRLTPFGYTDSDGIELNIIGVNPTGKSYVENYDYFLAKGMTYEEIKANPRCNQEMIYRNSDIVDENDLYRIAMEELEKCSVPVLDGTIDMVDFSIFEGSALLAPILSEQIIVIDKDINFSIKAKITGIERNYDNPLQTKVTISNVIRYTSVFKDLVHQGEKIDKITGVDSNGNVVVKGNYVQGKIDAHKAQIVGMIDVIEKPEDKYAILFECRTVGSELFGALAIGSRGILISSELDVKDEWIWRTAINSNAISATEINTGTLNANLIKAGVLESFNGKSWIDMEDGSFSFANGRIVYNNTDGFKIFLSSDPDVNDLETEFNKYKEEINGDIGEIRDRVEYIETDFGEIFADGIIEEAEANTIRMKLADLNKEKADIDIRYETIYNNVNLLEPEKSELNKAYNNFVSKHNELITTTENIIADGFATLEERDTFNRVLKAYADTTPALTRAFEEAVTSIASNMAREQINDYNELVQGDIQNVADSVGKLEDTMNESFRDGIIDEVEYIAILESLNILQTEKTDIDKNFESLYNNEHLTDPAKANLKTKYDNYVTAHNTLMNYVNESIGDRVATEEEKAEIDRLLENYTTALAEYGVKQTEAINNIASNDTLAITGALKEEINGNIQDVADRAGALEDKLGDYTADGILDEAEKQSIRSMLKTLATEKSDITNQYNIIYANPDLTGTAKSNLSTAYTSYNNSYNSLVTVINSLLLKTNITDGDRNTLDTAFANHDKALALYSTRVNEAVDAIAQKKKQDAVQESKDYYDTQIVVDKKGILTTVSKTYATKSELASVSAGLRNRALRTETPESFTFTNKENEIWQPYVIKGDVSKTECTVIFDFVSSLSFGTNGSFKFKSYYTDSNDVAQYSPVYDLTSEVQGKTRGTISFNVTWGEIKEGTNTFARFRGSYVSGSFKISNLRVVKGTLNCEWSPAPEDTTNYIDDAIYSMTEDLRGQIDGKIETYNQTKDPSELWRTEETKKSHIGDLWYNPNTQLTYRWDGDAWNVQQGAEPLAMEKRRVFTDRPTPPYDTGDLWITSLDGGELKTCVKSKPSGGTYDSKDWVAGLKYTDDSLVNKLQIELDNMIIGGKNLLRDALFEMGNVWTLYETNVGITSTQLHEGRKSVRSMQTGLTSDSYRGLSQDIKTFNIGEDITASIYTYAGNLTNIDNGAKLELLFKDSDDVLISTQLVDVKPTEKSKWERFTLTTEIPEGTVTITYRAYTVRNGVMWFASPKLEKGGKATDFTPNPEDTFTYTDNLIYDLQEQLDGKIQTWNQTTNPALNWNSTTKKQHVGDLWYNPDTAQTRRYSSSYVWELQPEAEKLAKTKSTVWYSTPTIPYYKGDIWILQSNDAHTAGKKGEILSCTTTRTYANYIASDWVKNIAYTDDTYAKTVESNISQRADSIELSVKGIEETAGVSCLSNTYAKNTSNWTRTGVVSMGTSDNNGTTWVLVDCSSGTEQAYAYVESECKKSTSYTFSMNYAPYDTSLLGYRIKLQQYKTDTGAWADIKTWSGTMLSTVTRSNSEYIEHKFNTSVYATKLRVWVGQIYGENNKVFVSNINIIEKGGVYATNSSISLLENKITSKVSAGEVGTIIEQNPSSVKIAWNKSSKYVQFESGGLAIYNGAVSTSKKRAFFDERGNHFWRDGYYLGKIGTNEYKSNPNLKGIVFDLEYDGAYMTWACRKQSTDDVYTTVWTYANKTCGIYTAGRLHAGCDIDMHGYTLRNVNFEGGGINGTMNFVQVTGVQSDGRLSTWVTGCTMQFQNGILINATFNS